MFRWRKRNEGFEWRTYVRTTILVRRHERRKRAEDVKAAAVQGVKEAGLKGVDAAGAALHSAQQGSLAALRWSGQRLSAGAKKSAAAIVSSARRGAAGAKSGMIRGRSVMGPKLAAAGSAAGRAASRAAQKLEPATAPLREPGLQLAIKLIAGVAALGALIRAYQFGWDGHALTALTVAAIAAMVWLVSRVSGDWHPGDDMRRGFEKISAFSGSLPWPQHGPPRNVVLSSLAVAAVAGLAAWMWGGNSPAPPSVSGLTAATSSSAEPPRTPAARDKAGRNGNTVEGSATARSGDTLKISSLAVRLAGVEAPDRLQTCLRPGNKRWDCSASARDALSKLVRGKRITCTLSGDDGADLRAGNCRTSTGLDIAAELVRNGHVFAASGFFAAYSDEESAARTTKSGLWAGDAQRPKEWRAARWEEAKSKAPDGCPIKGQVFRKSGKVYMLPWSRDYERARVDAAQGERWFCSEGEAKSAGWKPF